MEGTFAPMVIRRSWCRSYIGIAGATVRYTYAWHGKSIGGFPLVNSRNRRNRWGCMATSSAWTETEIRSIRFREDLKLLFLKLMITYESRA